MQLSTNQNEGPSITTNTKTCSKHQFENQSQVVFGGVSKQRNPQSLGLDIEQNSLKKSISDINGIEY